MTPTDYTFVDVPRDGVNDDVVRVLEWLVPEASRVEAKQPVVTVETTKAAFDLDAPRAGFVFRLAEVGAEIPVGKPVAVVCARPERPSLDTEPSAVAPAADQVITRKARMLIDEHGLSTTLFAGLPVVRAEDVEAVMLVGTARTTAPEAEDDAAAAVDPELARRLNDVLAARRQRMRTRFNRHVPTGELFYDRWELAKDYGFGEGTSVYDTSVIIGDVKVGRHCWIGPYTFLDGLHAALSLGDYVDIGAGTQIYTHNTIERALTGHRAPNFKRATVIGSCCFIAPHTVVAPGTVLGDHCFVAAGSYVEGSFASYSFVAGNPARQVGVVEVKGERARIRRFGPDAP